MNIEQMRDSAAAVVNVKDVASVLGVDQRTVLGELTIHGGSIPAVRVGRRVVVPRERFLAFFDGADEAAPAVSSIASAGSSTAEADAVTAVVRAKLIELLGALDERPRPAA